MIYFFRIPKNSLPNLSPSTFINRTNESHITYLSYLRFFIFSAYISCFRLYSFVSLLYETVSTRRCLDWKINVNNKSKSIKYFNVNQPVLNPTQRFVQGLKLESQENMGILGNHSLTKLKVESRSHCPFGRFIFVQYNYRRFVIINN